MKAIIIQLGLSGVWRRFFWKLGEGKSWLVAPSANQRDETRREREGAGQWANERSDVRVEGKEVEKGGWWREWCVCLCVCVRQSPPPFAHTTVSARLAAWKRLRLNPLQLERYFPSVCPAALDSSFPKKEKSVMKGSATLKHYFLINAIIAWKL